MYWRNSGPGLPADFSEFDAGFAEFSLEMLISNPIAG
jgi:hypothetical protein